MRKMLWATAGAMALLVAAACTDTPVLTDVGQRGMAPRGASRDANVTGAVFTSTNPVDDPGPGNHDLCQNQKDANAPAINCNIYFSKSFVWLSGGPGPSGLADGTYMFAVLEPGGQGGNDNPNDCTDKNLSDDPAVCPSSNTGAGDDWTHRVFSVASGVITYPAAGYPGGHDFVGGMIRLMGYDDTTNPGGEYIMAVCSLEGRDESATSQPGVDPSLCKYDAFKVDVTKPCDNPESDDCQFHPQGSRIETEVHLATTHVVVSNASPATLGSTVHDKATVTTDGGIAVPDGSQVHFYFWKNNDCTGTPFAGPSDNAISGASPASVDGGLPEGPLGAGSYSYKATFTSGDAHVVSSSEGECEPFKVNKADTQISTEVHDASHTNITNGTVTTGSYIHDKAVVGTQVGAIAITGTVTFKFYANGACTGQSVGTDETVAVGTESTPIQINTPGAYAYSAKYNGDDNYNASSNSDCEPLSVIQLGKTMGFWGNTNGNAAIVAAGG